MVGTSLDAQQILSLQRLISVGMDLRAQFNEADARGRYPNLWTIASGIPDLRRLLASIRGKILPTGEIDDNASPELRRIRREINERRNRIYRNLESLMRERAPALGRRSSAARSIRAPQETAGSSRPRGTRQRCRPALKTRLAAARRLNDAVVQCGRRQ